MNGFWDNKENRIYNKYIVTKGTVTAMKAAPKANELANNKIMIGHIAILIKQLFLIFPNSVCKHVR